MEPIIARIEKKNKKSRKPSIIVQTLETYE
jgi:hypothetical protein